LPDSGESGRIQAKMIEIRPKLPKSSTEPLDFGRSGQIRPVGRTESGLDILARFSQPAGIQPFWPEYDQFGCRIPSLADRIPTTLTGCWRISVPARFQ
jgi:hypothetical protein